MQPQHSHIVRYLAVCEHYKLSHVMIHFGMESQLIIE